MNPTRYLIVTAIAALALGAAACGSKGAFSGDLDARYTLRSEGTTGIQDAQAIVARLERLGVTAKVESASPSEVVLNLEGFSDGEHLMTEVLAPDRLAFHGVADEPLTIADDRAEALGLERERGYDGDVRWFTRSEAAAHRAIASLEVPPDTLLRAQRQTSYDAAGSRAEEKWIFYLLDAALMIGPQHVAEASAEVGHVGEPIVKLVFTEEGKGRFAAGTSALVNKVLAICLDDEVVSAPVVMEPITGGMAQINLLGRDGSESPETRTRRAEALAAGLLHPLEGRWRVAP